MMTYSEWVTQNPTLLQERTELDPATIEALTDWFGLRYLCDDDHFSVFFTREINMLQWQYDQMRRLESVQFDPMVSQYMERWANRTGDDTHNIQTNTEGTNKQETTGTNNGTSTSTPGVTETTETVSRPNTTTTTTGTSEGTTSGNSTTEGNTKEANGGTSETTGSTQSKTRNHALSGVLPDSSTYGTGTAAGEDGMPNVLNWTYASGQTGSVGSDDSTTGNKTTTSNEGSGESSTTVDSTATTNTESTSTTAVSGTDTTETTTTRSGSDSTVNQGTTSGTVDGQTTGKSTEQGSNSFSHTDKEISTGRGEAPQDMLDRARSYILKMNAFDWLRKQLDSCFLGVYNI